ncbi:MAG: hypothetical protein M3P40_09695 [Actinomycetota bacterium]|nr:hypothetical protein [Actinomycetota bacterium]
MERQAGVTRWIVWLGYQTFVLITIVPVLLIQSVSCSSAHADQPRSWACQHAGWDWLLGAFLVAAALSALAGRTGRWGLSAVLACAPLLALAAVLFRAGAA